ncbi:MULTISPECIES: TonB-dependent receptor [Sphingobium]|uniref:TonB-dependent receptor n=1 Tax=Sphingobium chungbukense TaxID=56193 RepID=A0A0M3APV2_9SPHN|nr:MULTISPECIES: TonB-dependent receptor [Sphingobium]KKW91860.1 TonB-dependent receptor [Sphingobium chungbukense]PJG46045.1 TonB-dependent receptor [Sphingobium sp. LB126]
MTYRHYLAATCAVLFVSAPAIAQDDVRPQADGVSSGDIVVTARRRDEALQDVPISVSAISGEQLARSGVTDVQGLQYRTPSLSITSAQSQRNTVAFSLRGQRTQETQLFTDPPVGTYFAEVVQPRPYGFGNSLYDLESVQVLKGVQGTLFGRNMTGGAVLVEPAHPKLGEFSGEIRGQYGNYDMHDLFGMVNVPVGDSVALRFAGKTRERDGWSHDIGSGLRLDNQNYDTFRVSALVSPGNGIESLTVFDWFKSNENGTASFLTSTKYPSALSNYATLADIPAQFAEAQQLFRSRRFTLNSGSGNGSHLDVFGRPRESIKNWGITNKTTWDLADNLTLKNIFGYRKQRRDVVQDYDGIPAFLIAPYQFARSRNISEELQLQAKMFENRLDLIAGGYYFEEKGLDGSLANTLPQLNIRGAGLDPFSTDATLFVTSNPGEGYSRTAAAFIAGTFKATDRLSLSGGLRYNYDKRKITVSPSRPNLPNGDGTFGVCSFDPTVPTGFKTTVRQTGPCAFTNSKSFKEWTYDATIQYEPSAEVTTYASYRHGFRAGGFSTRATGVVTLSPFLPEFVDEYEIGLKTNHRVGGGRLTTSTALFRQDGSDVQKQRATFVNGNVFTVVDNTAKQRNVGGEFEANFSTDTFSLAAFYSYTKVDIRSGRVTLNGLTEFEQRGVPKHQLGATATISPPVSENLGDLNFVLNYTWRSKIYLDDFEIEGVQPAYSLINLRAELNNVGGSRASVAAFVNNALNETYRIGVLGLMAEGLGFQNSVYGEPRTYGVEVSFKF